MPTKETIDDPNKDLPSDSDDSDKFSSEAESQEDMKAVFEGMFANEDVK